MSFSDLFRVIDDPFFGSARPTFYAPARALREAPFPQNSPSNSRSGVDLTEEGNNYIVEAELPGVKRENLNVTVGDGGRSVTIEGKVFRRNRGIIVGTQNAAIEGAPGSAQNTPATEGGKATPSAQSPSQPDSTYSSAFTRTVWLPRPVAASKVQAKLADGILTVTIPKAEEPQHVRVAVQ
ncbi:hypothetical protein PLICRDRAFT_37893 [Plicaturopsis crispa FD-325 SS-3]|nr:hypothetical protein PLICRDRAFT_37893 [Plicaturopsis crispa FD-325 SS-3]